MGDTGPDAGYCAAGVRWRRLRADRVRRAATGVVMEALSVQRADVHVSYQRGHVL